MNFRVFTRLLLCGLSGVIVCVSAAAARGATMIDTFPLWGGTAFGPFGEPDSATLGQTFTVPLQDSTLTGFTFRIDDFQDPERVDYAAYVMAWNGTRASGPILFESEASFTTNNGGADGWETVTIDTGGLALNPGGAYVAFLSSSELTNGTQGRSRWQVLGNAGYDGDFYDGGKLVFLNSGSNAGLWTMQDWWDRPGDLAFSMSFIPEPAGMIVMLALAGAGTALRRRRGFSIATSA